MDTITIIMRSIAYIENQLAYPDLTIAEIAKNSFCSEFHFQRLFSMICGLPVGEYVRRRRMSLAAERLSRQHADVGEIADSLGYESTESFSKAFTRFHGITPKAARAPGATLRTYSRLSISLSMEGGKAMEYRLETMEFRDLYGFRARFIGEREERFLQEEAFWEKTRDRQDELLARTGRRVWFEISMNEDGDGFDHYIAASCGSPVEGFEPIHLPKCQYAVFETERMPYPTAQLADLRRRIATEWLASSGYEMADAPEVTITHWHAAPMKAERYIEIWIPISDKKQQM